MLLLALSTCVSAFAQNSSPFQVQAYIVSGQDFFQNWNKEMDKQGDKKYASLETAKRGDDLSVAILFTGASKDPNGFARITFNLKMTKPDGKVISADNMRGAQGPMPDEIQRSWYLANDKPSLKNLIDIPGDYTFEITVVDQMARENKPLTLKLKVE